MQKLSRTSSGKNKKSCRFFTTNPTKLSLHFSDFSTIFYGLYKILQNSNTIWDSLLHWGPGISAGSQRCPYFADKTSEVFLTSQCRPWGVGWRGSPEFRRSGGRGRPGTGGWRSGERLGSISSLTRAEAAPVEPAWRSQAAAAAGSSAPATRRLGWTGERVGELPRCKRRWRTPQLGIAAGRHWCSPRRPLMVLADGSAGGWEALRVEARAAAAL
jgi:hypothetical protein